MMEWLTTRNKMRQKEGKLFYHLLTTPLLSFMSCTNSHLLWSLPQSSRFSIVVISENVCRTSALSASIILVLEYGITYYKSDCLDLAQNEAIS